MAGLSRATQGLGFLAEELHPYSMVDLPCSAQVLECQTEEAVLPLS